VKLADRLLGSPPVSATWRRLRNGLRVLAYHGVPDPPAFERHLEHLSSCYRPVGAEEVIDAVWAGTALGPRAVWVTFDDGEPDVLDHGLDALRRHGVPATLFVCPGVVGTDEPLWWHTVDRAVAAGAAAAVGVDVAERARLTQRPDDERREIVSRLDAELHRREIDNRSRQLSWDDLDRWVDAGNTVGNHTWDHPCLDQCATHVQRTQIEDADRALARYLERARTFAYPNGNWSADAEATLERLGYDVGVLFDHCLAAPATHPLRMSRLRVDSGVPIWRLRAIASGAHSAAFSLVTRIRDRARS
jgi:peptidoglycan/xylan/chitin deacetylase (PgdA/CDA1 family)